MMKQSKSAPLQRPSDGHRAGNDLVLQHDADHHEDKVQHEHDETEQLAHAPLAGGDGDDDEEEHEEEEHDGAEEAVGADLHRFQAPEQRPQEPGEGQPAGTRANEDNEYIANRKRIMWVFLSCRALKLPHSTRTPQ